MPPLLLGPFGLVILPLLAGAGAIYLLLPRPKAFPAVQGALLGVLALGLAGWLVVGFNVLTPESFLFYVFSAVAVGFGALLVTQRNPARAALSFALVVLSTCGLFLLLAAPFLMAAAIIIYAGAIIVTFLFVLMLAQQEGPSDADARSREPLLATIIGFVLLGALLYVLQLQWNYETTGEGQVLKDLLGSIGDARAELSEENLKASDGLNRSEILKPLIDALGANERQIKVCDDLDRNILSARARANGGLDRSESLKPLDDALKATEQQIKAAARDDRRRAALDREQRALQDLRQRLDPVFDQEQASRPPTVDVANGTLARLETVVLQAKQQLVREQRLLRDLRQRLDPVFDQEQASRPPTVDVANAALARLETAVLQAKQQYGWPQPEGGDPERASNLSPYSGPQPDLPPDQVRVDPNAGGAPYLPAENPSYLGRSLFTDYLLPVELGGFLLLVAAIGAIAIAQRRTTTETT